MAWGHNFKPPSGTPASGIPAKGAGKGDGWGGPARGAKAAKPRTAAEAVMSKKSINKDPIKKLERKQVAELEEERIKQLTDHLCDLGLNAEREETQVSATVGALNRLAGLPKAKTENVNIETSFEEMVKRSLEPKKT
jgi:hypothetical protein